MRFMLDHDGSWHLGGSRLICLIALSGLLIVISFAAFGRANDEGSENDPPGQVIEIRQGGYVEKVEPGVDYKDRLPRAAPLQPGESLKRFHLIPGFRIELAAAEPLVCDPVEITFDEQGRMFVAELITYSESQDLLTGRVSVLEDIDNDGKFDTRSVLVDQLGWPSGLLCFDGGVFVASPPDILYCKDTNGDGKADIRRTVITGFETSNPNQCVNSLRGSWQSGPSHASETKRSRLHGASHGIRT